MLMKIKLLIRFPVIKKIRHAESNQGKANQNKGLKR